MVGRVVAMAAILVCVPWGAGSAVAATSAAQPLQDAIPEAPSSIKMLFHPDSAASLAQLDGMASNRAANVLAVCVGAGCDARTVERIAADRGWPFMLAWDADGSTARSMLGTSSVPATIAPGRTAASRRSLANSPGLQGLAGRASQRATVPGLNASLSTPTVPSVVSARSFVMIGLPLMLLGLGGTAFFFASRRSGSRRPTQRQEPTDEERLEQFVRERHGRKRPPVRS